MDNNTIGVMNFDLTRNENRSIIKVVGVGGGGGNAVTNMYKQGIHDVSFALCNTDAQAMVSSPIPTKIQLGNGRGAGNVPAKAKVAAEKSKEQIEELLSDGTEMVFITAGMGGGTGTGAAPVVAKIAKDRGILTVGIVTIPFVFEGPKKILQALDGVEELSKFVDALLVINNEQLKSIYPDLDLTLAFAKADEVLSIAAKGISEIVTMTGQINLDFADVNKILKDGGVAIMSTGINTSKERRISSAINAALHSPLLFNSNVFEAKRLMVNITFNPDSKIPIGNMSDELTEFTWKFGPDYELIWGTTHDTSLGDNIKVTLLASGFAISDIPGYDELKNKKNEIQPTAEEQDRMEMGIRRMKKIYGESAITGIRSNFREFIVIMTPEQLSDPDFLDKVDSIPTFNRTVRSFRPAEIQPAMKNDEPESPSVVEENIIPPTETESEIMITF